MMHNNHPYVVFLAMALASPKFGPFEKTAANAENRRAMKPKASKKKRGKK